MGKKTESLNKKRKIINNYDSSADFYDKRYRTIQEAKYHNVLENSELKEKRILDIGCGTGLFIQYILNSKKNHDISKSKYIAVDISWKMLLKFQKKVLNQRKKTEVLLVLSDIENLPFRNNTFNIIFSLTSFQNLPNILEGIKETLRVSTNKGVFKLSILRKTLAQEEILNFLNRFVENIEVINKKDIEDVIIQGLVIK